MLVSVNLILWTTALLPFIRCFIGLSVAPAQCWAAEIDVSIGVAGSGYSGAADVVLALLPLGNIWDYKLRRLSRFMVMFAMSMAAAAAVSAFTQCSQIPNNNTASLNSKHFSSALNLYG